MQRFKFLTKAKPIEYDGEWSQHAIRLVREYNLNRWSGDILETRDAKYVIIDTIYQHCSLAAAVVKVYPIGYANTTITYWISIGRVTPFITDHNVEHHETI
jgi:hypothetical protein